MGIQVTGGSLEEIRRRLDELPTQFKGDLLLGLSSEALLQVQLGFEYSKDPYGQDWAPLKRPRRRDRGYAGKPLRDTSRLMNSFRPRMLGLEGFAISTNVKYAPFHQYGTRTAPKRQMVPEDSLPPSWEAAFDHVGAELLQHYMGAAH